MGNFNLKATLNKNGSITSTWSKIPNGVRYQLWMHTPGNSYAWFNEENITTTSFTSAPDLATNNWYWVQIHAYGSMEAVNWFDAEVVKIFIPYDFYDNTPLAVPANISATPSVTSVTVSYSAVARATSYDILFDGTVYNQGGTSKTFTGLSPKKSCTYSVRAKNVKLTGPYSSTKTVMTLPQLPSEPTNIIISVTENTLTLKWTASSAATGYEVLLNGITYNVTGTSTTTTVTGLIPNESYTCSVRAKNVDGYSSYSAVRTITTTPNPPANASVITSEDSAAISWPPVTGATSYDVILNGTSHRVTGTSTTITGLTSNTGYTYQIRANNADGSSSYSTAKTVKTASGRPTNASEKTTKNSVTISWSAVPGATSYDIIFNGTTYNVTGTSKTFTGLSTGSDCTYQIRSNSAGGSSSYSEVKKVTTLPNEPQMPGSVKATSTATSITLSWNAAAWAAGYEILLNSTTYYAAGTSTTITGLQPNTYYSYKVRAVNAGGPGSYSYADSIKTLLVAPGVPANISATATSSSVTVNFSAVSGADSYDILFNGTAYNTYSTYRTMTGLTPGMSCTYQVRANNTGGSSPYSTVQTITTIPNPPAMPVSVSATSAAETATVSWGAVSGAAGYDVLWNGTAYDVTGTSRTFTGLTTDTVYTYQVRAKNAGGSSSYSTRQTIRTLLNPPTVPLNVYATASSSTATVSFNPVSGAASYDILFNGIVYSTTITYITITGLLPVTTYTYQVRAKNVKGTSAYSAAKSVTTTPAPLPVPSNISATATANTVTISYSAVTGATSYDIIWNGTSYNVTATSRTFTGLQPGTNCTYQIRAKNASVTSAYTALTSKLNYLASLPKFMFILGNYSF